ncbi:hypothetical protein FQP90_13645 [Paenarthrobacter nitroguajacolicus]|uniref:Bacteriophage Mu GpT domain-containing protein n=1 Tax=Paenarthrobacter nitroguajacolicus TaxID=211146 RepID=A0A558GXJ7_PAENT|nr:hypothetical protein [Paenarthrobacter nitroguajacolicus]TVU61579.1 hypothetical protein FQP90_13645 [Paenarthrobacter nitroguajacolicus]
MNALNTGDILAKEGFRIAPSVKGRILEAAKLFNEGVAGKSAGAEYRMKEAFSTSDFPKLLGAAFQIEARDTYQNTEPEWQTFVPEKKVKDFRPAKNVDVFGGRDAFDDVAEGEEYKGRSLNESEFTFSAGKTGNFFALTFEARKNNEYYQLLDFPGRFGTAARATEDRKVFEKFVGATGPIAEFFGGSVSNKILNEANLLAAYKTIIGRKNADGLPVNFNGRPITLLIPQSLQFEAEALINEPRVDAGGGTSKKNPLFGKFNIVVSWRLSVLDVSANSATSWYLFPPKESDFAALGKVTMVGEETVDIRVKRDQGERVDGGAIGIEEGSIDDDTITYRGRHITGGAKLDTTFAYASTGTTA